eukprot:7463901-Lingulodinium_polyedra.AAC.1
MANRPSAHGVMAPAKLSRPTSADTAPRPRTSSGSPWHSASGPATTPRPRRATTLQRRTPGTTGRGRSSP